MTWCLISTLVVLGWSTESSSKGDTGDFNVNVYVIEQRTTYFGHVTLNLNGCAMTVPSRIATVSAGTRVECRDEYKCFRNVVLPRACDMVTVLSSSG